MNDRNELIAAFADGEAVPAPDLKAALADDDGLDYLIDVLALRGLIGDARTAAALTPVTKAVTGSSRRAVSWRLLAAAAVMILCVSGGYAAGRVGNQRTDDARVVAANPAPAVSAPAPTHVIRMENGVNWNEKAGGN